MGHWSAAQWFSDFELNQQALFKWQDRVGCATAKPVGTLVASKEIAWYDYATLDRDLAMLIATQGSGKTVQAQFDMAFHCLKGNPPVVLAPTAEYESQLKPQSNSVATGRLALLGLRPEAFPIQSFFPLEAAEQGVALPNPFDQYFSLQERELLVGTMLGVDSPAQELAVSMALGMGTENINAFEQGFRAYKASAEGENVGQILKMILDVKRRDLFRGKSMDFLGELQAGKILNVVGGLSGRTGGLARFVAAYLAVALPKWRREGKIGPAFVVREESSEFLGFLQGQAIVEEEISKQRKSGLNYLYVLQDLEMAKRTRVYTQMLKACVLRFPALPALHLENIADCRLLADASIAKLMALSGFLGGRPPVHVLVRPDNSVDFYDPFPCLGAFKHVLSGAHEKS